MPLHLRRGRGDPPALRPYMLALLLLFTLLSGLATGFVLAYRLLALLALYTALAWAWGRWGLWGLEVEVRRPSGRLHKGDLVKTTFRVRNPSPLPRPWLAVMDRGDMPGYPSGRLLALGPWARREWEAYCRVQKRGLFTLGPAEAHCADPFGLFLRRRRFGRAEEVLVYPSPVPLPYFRIPQAELAGEESASRRSLHITPLSSGIRDYRQGDAYKRIHWPSTARTGRLMVKEFDTGVGNRLWLVVDLQEAVQAGDALDNTEELAITVAASVGERYLGLGWPVGLLAQGDRRYFLPPERGAGRREGLLRTLAVARARGRKPLARVLTEEPALVGSSAVLVVITPSPDPSWALAVEALVGHRTRVVAVVVDPASFGGPGDTSGLVGRLRSRGVPTYVARRGDDLATALDSRGALAPVTGGGL